jgi:ribosomal protein L7/L12
MTLEEEITATEATIEIYSNILIKLKAKRPLVDIHLHYPGFNKIHVIKLVRDITGLGLKEVKDLVCDGPSILIRDLQMEEASKICRQLADLKAIVSIHPTATCLAQYPVQISVTAYMYEEARHITKTVTTSDSNILDMLQVLFARDNSLKYEIFLLN